MEKDKNGQVLIFADYSIPYATYAHLSEYAVGMVKEHIKTYITNHAEVVDDSQKLHKLKLQMQKYICRAFEYITRIDKAICEADMPINTVSICTMYNSATHAAFRNEPLEDNIFAYIKHLNDTHKKYHEVLSPCKNLDSAN